MNFGAESYNWFLSNAQSSQWWFWDCTSDLRGNFPKLIGFLVVSPCGTVGLVFNAEHVKDILLELFNKLWGP